MYSEFSLFKLPSTDLFMLVLLKPSSLIPFSHRIPTFVAIIYWSLFDFIAFPINSSDTPDEYTSAVSIIFIPKSRHAFSIFSEDL